MAVHQLMKNPPLLYDLCLNLLVCQVEQIYARWNGLRGENPLDKLAGSVAQDILEAAYLSSYQTWMRSWKVLLNPNLRSAILPWDENLTQLAMIKCQKLQQILVAPVPASIDLSLLPKLAASVSCVDFDGELYFRGRLNFDLRRIRGPAAQVLHWLPESEALQRALYISQQRPPNYLSEPHPSAQSLSQIHLGTVRVSPPDICHILEALPNIQLLRHYQLVSALYLKHGDQWRIDKVALPRYKLLNLDVDFSHVVRCRMSPQSVLPIDALSLAIALCPQAESVRIRYDCSTHHDSIEAVTSLVKLKELSIVCVTSGERCLLDFSDIAPILEVHGGNQLKYLELKVIEEVDPHVIIQSCPKLRVLTLSGCGFVTPDSCQKFQCGRNQPKHFLSRLRLLFYADGDDFSWDHSLPQCFWYSTLSPPGGGRSHLRGLFLESPRILDSTLAEILKSHPNNLVLPELQIVSLCRYSELSFQNLQALTSGANLLYVRISQCDQFKEHHMKRLGDLIRSEAVLMYEFEMEEEATGGVRVGRAAK